MIDMSTESLHRQKTGSPLDKDMKDPAAASRLDSANEKQATKSSVIMTPKDNETVTKSTGNINETKEKQQNEREYKCDVFSRSGAGLPRSRRAAAANRRAAGKNFAVAAISNSEEESDVEQSTMKDEKDDRCSTEGNTIEDADDEDSDIKFACPICSTMLSSQHDFTLHIRSHNNDLTLREEEQQQQLAALGGKGFTCRICGKVLSSSSSLDRHVLVHSGERPFNCRICGVSFTTNGNMHRHMRTHPNVAGKYNNNNNNAESNYESDDSTDSSRSIRKTMSSPPSLKRRRTSKTATSPAEFNNNNIQLSPIRSLSDLTAKRKNVSDEDGSVANNRRKPKTEHKYNKFKCPVCDREDFLSLNLLETHLEEVHPEYKARCEPCNLIFKNHRVLNLHRFMVHPDQDQYVSKGTADFNDLTFVDFSSEKFPYIARMVCEQSVPRTGSAHQQSQCERCQRAFPLASALTIHQQNCCYATSTASPNVHATTDQSSSEEIDSPTVLSRTHGLSESDDNMEDVDRKRDSFFARLDLQNKSSPSSSDSDEQRRKTSGGSLVLHNDSSYFSNASMMESKDLADIQSIISVTSAGGMMPDLSKSPQPVTLADVTPPDSATREEEEQQDCFAAEFRKMKLRGEFPCRLCTMIFPNLRALKGHNRVHLSAPSSGINNVPYRCNMCPHFSTDKSALIRHMRTHNGDRPYECGLCHYAFTTKANCERHLRNRHAKMSREDVKKSIIYHPSEDPTNDINAVTTPASSGTSSREEIKRTLFTDRLVKDNNVGEIFENSKPVLASPPEMKRLTPIPTTTASTPTAQPLLVTATSLSTKESQTNTNVINIPPMIRHYPNNNSTVEKSQAVNMSMKINERRKSLDVATMTSDEEIDVDTPKDYDVPLDLSMDVLDLSRKQNNERNSEKDNSGKSYEDEKRGVNREEDMAVDRAEALDVPQDLSNKKRNRQNDDEEDEIDVISNNERPKIYVRDFNRKTPPMVSLQQQLLQQPPQFDKQHNLNMPKLNLSQFYASGNPTAMPPSFFLGNSPAFPAFPSAQHAAAAAFSPYFLTPPPAPVMYQRNPTQDYVEMKERLQKELLRGLQLTSGGSLVLDQIAMATAADRIQLMHNQAVLEYSRRIENSTSANIVDPKQNFSPKPESNLATPPPDSSEKPKKYSANLTPKTTTPVNVTRHESSSVKMVIKNGVLIPKQKQRRYRTERPFSCEHCSARFTLRSNMERHIKQQHPQYWTQRQRSGGHSAGRRGHNASKCTLQPVGSLNSQLSYFPHLAVSSNSDNEASRPSSPREDPIKENSVLIDVSKTISSEVRNAIALQLKSKHNVSDDVMNRAVDEASSVKLKDTDIADEDEETSEQLIIDEERKYEDDNDDEDEYEDEDEISDNERMGKASKLTSSESKNVTPKDENVVDLASVSRLLDNASTQTFKEYFHNDEDQVNCENSEEDEEGLVAGSSEGNNSGSDENKSECETTGSGAGHQSEKKKSAYSLAPNRVSCPYCFRKFPWSSSLRRHVLTHTGQKPFKCTHCSLLFTTKSNCDRHLLRKHGNNNNNNVNNNNTNTIAANTGNNTTQAPSAANNNGAGTDDATKQNSLNYTMRNVPERPYKCKYCPSSTFSTLSNLKKHLSCKHVGRRHDHRLVNHSDEAHSGCESAGEGEEMDCDANEQMEQSSAVKNSNDANVESRSSLSLGTGTVLHDALSQGANYTASLTGAANAQVAIASDLPFKCHLCDSSFADRQEALDHIRDFHTTEFQLLASKGALEAGAADDPAGQDDPNSEENLEHLRGKFPDYANRKVMCAFCLRRFWSAEDLRRHMRTHTGERPFSCDICRRRFTLKHSMLRHRKKHSLLQANSSPNASDDEPPTLNNNNDVASANKMIHCHEESDLISNLLGIHDRSIVDKMLISKSAEDAAKLLGVHK